MKTRLALATLIPALAASVAQAHFLELLPNRSIVSTPDEAALEFRLAFSHPMEQGPLMHMETPVQFGVLAGEQRLDLRDRLQPVVENDATRFNAAYTVEQPADLVFFAEPAPYWEPAEGKMIVHYTKVVVSAFDAGEGWDAMVGFPVEIEPLTRPYGLWTGNLFRGIVRKNGEPVPFAEIEVEFFNEGGAVTAPAGPFVTQVIKADAHGVFAYTMPRAGWWGFAALIEGDEPMTNPAGKTVPVELGGLIWVHAVDMQ